jgi:hypothetical protein
METIYNSLKGSALIKRDSMEIELAIDLIKFTNLQNIFYDSKSGKSFITLAPGPNIIKLFTDKLLNTSLIFVGKTIAYPSDSLLGWLLTLAIIIKL